jgi:hypothetical protein
MNKQLLKFISILSFFVVTINLKAQIKIVEINASALLEDKSVGDYSLLIYVDGKIKDSVYCKKPKAFTLSLETSKLYSIVFQKASYPNKLIIVDTHIPSGLRELVEEPFELQIELAKTSATLKEDLSDYPVSYLSNK